MSDQRFSDHRVLKRATSLAVMEIPDGTQSFEFVFEQENNEGEAKITFDLEKRRILLVGRDEAVLRNQLARLLENGGAEVAQGQELRLHQEGRQRFEYIFKGGVLIREKAPELRLKVTARDASGNFATAAAVPTFAVK